MSRFAALARRLQVPDTPAWRAATLFVAVLVPVGLAAAYALDPVATEGFPRCPVRALTGLQCPGCGTARALHAAMHGRFAEALRYNAALPFGLAFLAALVAWPRLAMGRRVPAAAGAALAAWFLARNLLGV